MRQLIATIQVGVEGFSPIENGNFLLALRWGENIIALPITREAMKELKPRFGDLVELDLCLPEGVDDASVN